MKLHWKVPGGLPECPYFHKWVLDVFGLFAIRLHLWHRSDDARAWHDHPFWFLTLVLRGSYADVSDAGRDVLRRGSIRFRPASHRHTVEILQPETLTLLITGPAKHRWSFWVGNKKMKRDKYFAEFGHHPCETGQPPVRMRPDGTRI